jgi:toxin ParE1/3/4
VILRTVLIQAVAAADIDRAIDFYRIEAGSETSERFVRKLEQTLQRLSQYPEAGSLRYAHSLSIDDLRSIQIKGFPWMLFYILGTDVSVIRLLHSHSDIPAWLLQDRD